MLDNGTIINGKMVETPKSFQTACTITTQIVAQVASQQFGGQSISIAHLAPYVRKSAKKIYAQVLEEFNEVGLELDVDAVSKITVKRLQKEIEAGIQTINYQLNTLQTSNG